jgi:hypothetical protein
VGGVCTQSNDADSCPQMDMKAVPVRQAIYSSATVPDACQKPTKQNPEMKSQDFAIVELDRDVVEAEPFTASASGGNIKVPTFCFFGMKMQKYE